MSRDVPHTWLGRAIREAAAEAARDQRRATEARRKLAHEATTDDEDGDE